MKQIQATSAVLENVDIYNNTITEFHSNDGSPWSIERWGLRHCSIYNNTSNGSLSLTVGNFTAVHDNIIIRDSPKSNSHVSIEAILQSNYEAYRNYTANSGFSIVVGLAQHSGSSDRIVGNMSIWGNVFHNSFYRNVRVKCRNDGSGIYLVTDVDVFNNTVDANFNTTHVQDLVRVNTEQNGSGSVEVRNVNIMNNLLVNSLDRPGEDSGNIANLVIDHNHYWNNAGGDSWNGSSESNELVGDPLFVTGQSGVDQWKLQAGSPAISNPGVDVGLGGEQDIWGNTFSSTPNRGAYQGAGE